MSNEKETKKPATSVEVKTERNIVDGVLTRITQFQQLGEIQLPKDYSAENALKSAYLILAETKDLNKKPVLETCTRESIANSLLDMVVQGLSPMKKQCSFIAYDGKLSLQREYHGTVMLARRFGGVQKVTANIIYEADEFSYEIDPKTGYKKIIKHVQNFENIDMNKIKGAYATLILEDGTSYVEVMNIFQIRTAWNQGFARGNSPAHKNFPDEMCKKTVINRACKLFISTSDDSGVFKDIMLEEDVILTRRLEAPVKANKTELKIDAVHHSAEEVKEEKSVGQIPSPTSEDIKKTLDEQKVTGKSTKTTEKQTPLFAD